MTTLSLPTFWFSFYLFLPGISLVTQLKNARVKCGPLEVGGTDFTCLWWRTCRCWHLQNFPASFAPLHTDLQVDHPLGWAACILGTKAEEQSDLSYSSGSENLWNRENGNVNIDVWHVLLKSLWVCYLATTVTPKCCASWNVAKMVSVAEDWAPLRVWGGFRGRSGVDYNGLPDSEINCYSNVSFDVFLTLPISLLSQSHCYTSLPKPGPREEVVKLQVFSTTHLLSLLPSALTPIFLTG